MLLAVMMEATGPAEEHTWRECQYLFLGVTHNLLSWKRDKSGSMRTFESISHRSSNVGKKCLPVQILACELLVSFSLKGQDVLIKDPVGRLEQTY